MVITGASSGIGRAAAYAFAEEGTRLVLTARREGALQEVADACEERGASAVAVPADVTNEEALQAVVELAEERFGGIDVWVNNAAVTAFGRFEDVPAEDFRRVIETNFFGYVNGARAALGHFRERKRGVLINVGSVVGAVPQPYTSAYVTSKWAIRGLNECLRMEMALEDDLDIEVCHVAPASIDTPLFQQGANYTGRTPRALDPTYAPEFVADVIVRVSHKPRRETVAGNAAYGLMGQHAVAPALYERTMARKMDREHFKDQPAPRSKGNLYEPMEEYAAVRGGWEGKASFDLGRATRIGAAVMLPALAVGVAIRRLQTR